MGLATAGGLAALCLGDVGNLRRQSGEAILNDGHSPCFKYAHLRKCWLGGRGGEGRNVERNGPAPGIN